MKHFLQSARTIRSIIFVSLVVFLGAYSTAHAAAPMATNLSAPETYTEDTALNLVDIVASDSDSANVTATLTLSSTAVGSLSTGTSGTVTSTYNSGTGVWTAAGAIANVNTLLAGLVFTPASNSSSSFTIATSVSDGVDSVSGDKAVTGVAANDAPVLDASRAPVLSSVLENAGAPVGAVGTQIISLIDAVIPVGGLDNVSDSDSSAQTGIAITGIDSNLTCYYSTNGGASWFGVGSLSNTSARLLSSATTNRIYCIAGVDRSGTYASAITFRAWDQTSGVDGGTASTTTNGGTSAFSTATDTASLLVVNTVNSSPTAVDDEVTTIQGSPVFFSVLANDTDPENDTLSMVFLGTPSYGSGIIVPGEQVLYMPMAGFFGDDTFSYTITDPSGETSSGNILVHVIENTPPTIDTVSPSDGAIGQPVDVPIVITFSEPMDTISFVVSTSPCGGSCPTYDVVWSAGDTVATLTKSNGLFDPETEYTITIEAITRDANGNDLATDYTWSFTTYIPLVMTEVKQVPERARARDLVYYFDINDDVADYGVGDYLADSCDQEIGDNTEAIVNPIDHTFTIKNVKPGKTYECLFQFNSTLRGTSNQLRVGPVTVLRDTSVSGNTSLATAPVVVAPVVVAPTVTVAGSSNEVPQIVSILKLGSSGAQVVALQKMLNTRGNSLTSDGQFGPKTKAAVVAFQKANNLTPDGIVGPKTVAVLTK
jgi:hypothetical protein